MKLYCCWEIMNDSQHLGIVTDTLEKAQEYKKNHPNFDSIYSVDLNEPIKEDDIWGEYVE